MDKSQLTEGALEQTKETLYNYFMAHVRPQRGRKQEGFYEVTTPLKGFKKVYRKDDDGYHTIDTVASLLIPEGALVYVYRHWALSRKPMGTYSNGDYDYDAIKMRASEAKVVQIAETSGSNGIIVKSAVSDWDQSFKYRTGRTVRPVHAFCRKYEECASGIHFFLTLNEAYHY